MPSDAASVGGGEGWWKREGTRGERGDVGERGWSSKLLCLVFNMYFVLFCWLLVLPVEWLPLVQLRPTPGRTLLPETLHK